MPRPRRSARTARRRWDSESDAYERRHRRALATAGGASWGLYRIPESELKLLDPVRGRDTLEVGCGAADWSRALARRGARAVGLDFSAGHLAHARANVRGTVALAQANAERLPFRSERFDLAFCDWGALFFADPDRTIPEVARVLRPGGQLVFATGHPMRAVGQSRETGRMGRRLAYGYFGLGPVRIDSGREHHRTFADWFDLFGRAGFTVERLLEPRAPARRTTSYLSDADHAWGRRWPLELIWSLRRRGGRVVTPRTKRASSR